MPDGQSPSDWLSFNEYLGLTGEEINRLEEERLAQADALNRTAQEKLAVSGQEAQRTGQAMTRTGSYSDYLAAQQAARNAYAALQVQSSNPYIGGVQEMVGRDERETARQSVSGMGAAEAAWAQRAKERQQALFRSREESAAAAAKAAQEKAERDRSFGEVRDSLGYDDGAAKAYGQWASDVEGARKQDGGIGAGAYFWGGKPQQGGG